MEKISVGCKSHFREKKKVEIRNRKEIVIRGNKKIDEPGYLSARVSEVHV